MIQKIMVHGDPHFGFSGSFSTPTADGFSTRLNHSIALQENLIKEIESRKPQYVVNLGDLYKSQGTIEATAVAVCARMITRVASACASVGATYIVLLGNHDMISESRAVSSIDWLEELPNTLLVRQPMVLNCEGFNLVLCPYLNPGEPVIEFLEENSSSDSYFFGHLSLGEVVDSRDYSSGNIIDMVVPAGKGTVSSSMLSRLFDVSFNGHHHVPQRPVNSVILPGSFQQFTPTEQESQEFPRGIWILNIGEPGNGCTVELLANKITPRIWKCSSLEELKGKAEPRDYIIYYGKAGENKAEILHQLSQYSQVRYVPHKTVIKVDKDSLTTKLTTGVSTPREQFSVYLNSQGNQNTVSTHKLGIEILEEAEKL